MRGTDIAVIGMSGQFPDAGDVHRFWENLMAGRDCVHELPAHYLDQAKYFSAEKQPGKTYSRWGGILQDRDCFDPLFFNISPREARSMSPHQRLILQESWKSLEDAGYNPKELADKPVGVFIGAEPAGYFHETFTGASDAIIASRLSYYLNLRGPAMVVNTGCSSSGVAHPPGLREPAPRRVEPGPGGRRVRPDGRVPAGPALVPWTCSAPPAGAIPSISVVTAWWFRKG